MLNKRYLLLIWLTVGILQSNAQEKVYNLPSTLEPSSNNQFKVVIDPGHGGKDSVTRGGGLLEKNLVFDISLEIKKQLEDNGYKVILTRSGDDYVPLSERSAIKGDIFISLHANAVADSIGPSVRSMIKGLEIYTSKNMANSQLLTNSTLLAKSFEAKFKELNGMNVRGIKKKNLAVLDNNVSPAILIELGFLSNEEDLMYLRDKANYKQIGEAVIKAIKDFRSRKID